jgi:uncharacterized OsmC-like protein
MKATIKWTGEASFAGQADSGHTVIMDGAPEFGGRPQLRDPADGGGTYRPWRVYGL